MEIRKGQRTIIRQAGQTTVMGTGASSVEKRHSEKSFASEEFKDPKSVLFKSARRGNKEDLTLVIQQGMDPNERESPFSG